jgi:hypothetical protein
VTASREARGIQERVLSFFITFGVAEGDVFTFIQWWFTFDVAFTENTDIASRQLRSTAKLHSEAPQRN